MVFRRIQRTIYLPTHHYYCLVQLYIPWLSVPWLALVLSLFYTAKFCNCVHACSAKWQREIFLFPPLPGRRASFSQFGGPNQSWATCGFLLFYNKKCHLFLHLLILSKFDWGLGHFYRPVSEIAYIYIARLAWNYTAKPQTPCKCPDLVKTRTHRAGIKQHQPTFRPESGLSKFLYRSSVESLNSERDLGEWEHFFSCKEKKDSKKLTG